MTARGRLDTTSRIKNIGKGKGVVALALDKHPASSDLESHRYFQNSISSPCPSPYSDQLFARSETQVLSIDVTGAKSQIGHSSARASVIKGITITRVIVTSIQSNYILIRDCGYVEVLY